VACNFNCLFKNKGRLNVTCSYVHSNCGSVTEMVQDGFVVTADH